MERLENLHGGEKSILEIEHRHRYSWAAEYAFGDVCDIACGEGYGSEILMPRNTVLSYVGIDRSGAAVTKARHRYSNSSANFVRGSVTEIPLSDKSVDTVVSLETLEHISEPREAIKEFRRIMRDGAILVGSVPSKHFDDLCEEVYGYNPYHVRRFTYEFLRDLLEEVFPAVQILYSAVEVVSHIGLLCGGRPANIEEVAWTDAACGTEVNGSLHFVASGRDSPNVLQKRRGSVQLCEGYTHLYADQIAPLRRALDKNMNLVRLRDRQMGEMEIVLGQRESLLATTAELVRQKDKALAKAAELLDQKDEALAQATKLINKNNKTIPRMIEVLRRKWNDWINAKK